MVSWKQLPKIAEQIEVTWDTFPLCSVHNPYLAALYLLRKSLGSLFILPPWAADANHADHLSKVPFYLA